ncbi:MAG: hypothetical protein UU77_C0053G0013 [candidate division WWE3 bacterium GW2011_GWC1_41_7]|uniref:Ribose-5-phosphate isomerase n=3 Tax=Katanobacteria TaxID=422282 RepID=A0A0G0X9S2_UNCKA|nr:MAG: hypothetical protein UU72_C0023G0014 [candidate division WWE3 bacterium GW2011_GWB1_41_6]KKS19308.1 MAG: hypothetical protein UU77_C0053G0013 [candidate division WWE3 bacterium GW2011_GWC1_41_7]KKS21680.1 MAG: hypothetical protein UU80_C0023G0013 [candidate division WWE3 bacterium GW2011_GWA1_41_8]
MIYIASDHGGFELKEKIIGFLEHKGILVSNKGPFTYDLNDDYPDYVAPVISKMREDPGSKAIFLCRNGVGVSVLANKFKGIRAALSWNTEHARSSRNDDDSNVLALPSDHLSEEQAFNIVAAWLDTPFSNEERHIRRLEKVKNLEKSAHG